MAISLLKNCRILTKKSSKIMLPSTYKHQTLSVLHTHPILYFYSLCGPARLVPNSPGSLFILSHSPVCLPYTPFSLYRRLSELHTHKCPGNRNVLEFACLFLSPWPLFYDYVISISCNDFLIESSFQVFLGLTWVVRLLAMGGISWPFSLSSPWLELC